MQAWNRYAFVNNNPQIQIPKLSGEQWQIMLSWAFPFDNPKNEQSLLSGTNFVAIGFSLVIDYQTGQIGLFQLNRDSGAVKNERGSYNRDPGSAKEGIGESFMIPGISITGTKGYILGDCIFTGLEEAYSGGAVSLEAYGSVLAGDIWKGVDSGGKPSDVYGFDVGVRAGTLGGGLVVYNASSIFVSPKWREPRNTQR